MKLLLDTCCIIWAVSDPDSLSKATADLLREKNSEVFVSPVSAAEIACAVERNRIKLNQHWKTWFRQCIDINKWQVENIDLSIIEEAYSLPETFHDDPVDRLIVATARLKNYTILTADQKILAYPHVNSIW